MAETLIPIMPWLGGFGLLVAVITFVSINRYSPGNEKMVAIANQIHLGAMVFLKREYSIIAIFMVVIFVAKLMAVVSLVFAPVIAKLM
jgi:K(+)-stimulated pyrophosphate-energized sodium pump